MLIEINFLCLISSIISHLHWNSNFNACSCRSCCHNSPHSQPFLLHLQHIYIIRKFSHPDSFKIQTRNSDARNTIKGNLVKVIIYTIDVIEARIDGATDLTVKEINRSWMKHAVLETYPGTWQEFLRIIWNQASHIYNTFSVTMSVTLVKSCCCSP